MFARKDDDSNFMGNFNADAQKPFGGLKMENPIRGGRKTPNEMGQFAEGGSTAMQNDSSNFEQTPKPKFALRKNESKEQTGNRVLFMKGWQIIIEETRSSNIFTKPTIRVASREANQFDSKSEVFQKDQPKGIQPKETQQPEQAGRTEFNESFYSKPLKNLTQSVAIDKKKEESERIQKQIQAEERKRQQALEAEAQKSAQKTAGKSKKEEKDEYDEDFENDDDKDDYDDDFESEDTSATYKPLKNTLTQPVKPNFSKTVLLFSVFRLSALFRLK